MHSGVVADTGVCFNHVYFSEGDEMSYFDEAEKAAFLDSFLNNCGSDIAAKDAWAFLNDLNNPNMDEQTLYDAHEPSVFTAVTDAINIWNAGKRFGKQLRGA